MIANILTGTLLLALSGLAETAVVYQTGFEEPDFHTGRLRGQNGWSGSSVGMVENTIANGGTQAVVFNPAGASGQNQVRIATRYNPVTTASDAVVVLRVAAMFSSSGRQTNWNPLVAFSSAGFIRQIGVVNGYAGIGDQGKAKVARGTWNIFELRINYTTHLASAFVNGTFAGSAPIATSHTDLVATAIGINSAPGTDLGYFDDLSVTATIDDNDASPQTAAPDPQEHGSKSSLTSVDGNLRKLGDKDLYLQTNSQTELHFRLSEKTAFTDLKGTPIRDSLLKPGDHLSVLVSPDDPETALRVVQPETSPNSAAGPMPASAPAQPGVVYNLGNGVSMPVVLKRAAPEYSDIARKLHAEGRVILEIVVRPNGKPQDFKVLKSLGYGLDQKAIEAVRKWQFRPGRKDGHAVAVRTSQDVNFSLGAGDGADWSSGPMAFAHEDGVALPVIRAGTMPKPDPGTGNKGVILEFTVDASGSVKNIQSLYGSQTASDLLSGILETWKFQPAVKDNRPVEATGRVRFVKDQGDEAPVWNDLTPPGGNRPSASGSAQTESGTSVEGGGPVYRVGRDGASQPQVLVRVDPDYSEAARRAKFSGTVLLELVVDVDGRAKNIKVIKGIGLGLDEKAMEAVRKWIFRPGSKDGRLVPTYATVEVNFRLL